MIMHTIWNRVSDHTFLYQCEACDKWFTSSGHLKRHFNTTLHKNASRTKPVGGAGRYKASPAAPLNGHPNDIEMPTASTPDGVPPPSSPFDQVLRPVLFRRLALMPALKRPFLTKTTPKRAHCVLGVRVFAKIQT